MQPRTPKLTLSASPSRPRLTMRNAPGLRLQRERRELNLRTLHRGRAGKDGDAEHQDQDQEDSWQSAANARQDRNRGRVLTPLLHVRPGAASSPQEHHHNRGDDAYNRPKRTSQEAEDFVGSRADNERLAIHLHLLPS